MVVKHLTALVREPYFCIVIQSQTGGEDDKKRSLRLRLEKLRRSGKLGSPLAKEFFDILRHKGKQGQLRVYR